MPFLDSFEVYRSLSDKGWAGTGQIVMAGRAWGTFALAVTGTGNVMRDHSPTSSVSIGAAVDLTTGRTGVAAWNGFAVFNSLGEPHMALGMDETNILYLYRYGATDPGVVARADRPVRGRGYHYIEFEFGLSQTAGTVKVRLDGVLVIDFSGRTARYTQEEVPLLDEFWDAKVPVEATALAYGSQGGTAYYDDVYFVTGDLLSYGDLRVYELLPRKDGTLGDFTPSYPWQHCSQVSECPADGNGTYVYSSTAGNRDTYELDKLSDRASEVLAVIGCVRVRQTTSSGGREFGVYFGSTYTSCGTFGATVAYDYEYRNFTVNPVTSATFSVTEVNGYEFGVGRVA